MRRFANILIVALIAIVLSSCASFKEFSAEFDSLAPYMLKGGTNITAEDMRADWMIGSWNYTESIQHGYTPKGGTTTDDPAQETHDFFDVFADMTISGRGGSDSLSSFIDAKFSRTQDKYPITVYDLKVSKDHDKVVLAKLETEVGPDGSKDRYIIVRTLEKTTSSYSFIVTFDSAGGTGIAAQKVSMGDTYTTPADPVRNGYVFAGWYHGNDKCNSGRIIGEDMMLTAHWDKIAPKAYTVSFDSVGGSAVAKATVEAGQVVGSPASPSKNGYIFTGWAKDGKSYDFATPVNADVSLKAQWEERVETYTADFFSTKYFYSQCKDVQWHVADGILYMHSPAPLYNATTSTQLSVSELSDGAYIRFGRTNEKGMYSQTLFARDGSVKAVLSRKGRICYISDYGFLYKADPAANNSGTEFCSYFYTNKGLNADGSTPDNSKFTYSAEEISDDGALEKAIAKSYTITFDSVGGTKVASLSGEEGKAVAAPASPDKPGYIFGGWTHNGKAYDFNTALKEDITLKAKWDTKVEVYAAYFFDTKFYYAQCKDVQWNVSGGKLNMSGPAPLYNATTSRQLSEADLADGAYIRFAKTDKEGMYSQTLYAKNGKVKAVLSKAGRISYFGEYGFLYKADPSANNSGTEYCSYFYTNKGLNPDGTTPATASFSYTFENVSKDSVLENFGK